MKRGRLVVLGVVAALVATTALVRVLEPERYDAVLDSGRDVVDGAPEPAVIAATVLVVLAIGIVVFIELARLAYWVWTRIRGRVLWVWDAILPKSPIVRFGVGLTIMVLVFLVGPLLVLQTLDLFEDSEDPLEQQNTSGEQDDPDNETNTTTPDNTDEPDNPDEPPDSGTGDSGDDSDTVDDGPDGLAAFGNGSDGLAAMAPLLSPEFLAGAPEALR